MPFRRDRNNSKTSWYFIWIYPRWTLHFLRKKRSNLRDKTTLHQNCKKNWNHQHKIINRIFHKTCVTRHMNLIRLPCMNIKQFNLFIALHLILHIRNGLKCSWINRTLLKQWIHLTFSLIRNLTRTKICKISHLGSKPAPKMDPNRL